MSGCHSAFQDAVAQPFRAARGRQAGLEACATARPRWSWNALSGAAERCT